MLRVAPGFIIVTRMKCVVNLCVPRVSPTGNMHVAFTFHVSCTVPVYHAKVCM